MASNLTKIRQDSNCKMRQLAVRAGVSASTISDIERYGYVPQPATQQKIASALEVKIDAIWPKQQGPSVENGEDQLTDSSLEKVG